VFVLSVKVKLFVSLLCMCNFACKDRPQNDLYCVGQDVKPELGTLNLKIRMTNSEHYEIP